LVFQTVVGAAVGAEVADGGLSLGPVSVVVEGGAPEMLQRLAQTYVGPGTVFPPFPDPPPGFITHVTPTRVAGLGPWADA